MYKTLSLEYSDLLLHDRTVLEYLSGHADIFTGIGRQYDRLDRMLQTFEPFLLQKEMNVKKWETTTTEGDGVTLYRYFLCDACRTLLRNEPNLFHFSVERLEDLCFYKNGQERAWFVSCTHERFAYMPECTEEDIRFFHHIGVRIHPGEVLEEGDDGYEQYVCDEKSPDIGADFHFDRAGRDSAADGGILQYLVSGVWYKGIQHYVDMPGRTAVCPLWGAVTFFSEKLGPLHIGEKIMLRDEKDIIGYAQVTEIYNADLTEM